MKGYKVFHYDWTCYNCFQYEVGKSYEMDDTPVICKKGFHFCEDLKDCFIFYPFNPNHKVAEIEAYGDIVMDDTKKVTVKTDGVTIKDDITKACTNKIRIIREIPWHEVLDLVNKGKYNKGYCNSGNWNSGDRNSGDYNTGFRNSGNYNSGNYNSGECNTGGCNDGDCNTGFFNLGNYNTGGHNNGDYNTGDFNSGNYNSGCFNTCKNPTIIFFNKESSWTMTKWVNSRARRILMTIPTPYSIDEGMRDSESNTGVKKEAMQSWWESLEDSDKKEILSLPNFDAEIFKEITGIDITKVNERKV